MDVTVPGGKGTYRVVCKPPRFILGKPVTYAIYEKTLLAGYSASYPTILNPVAQNNESITNTRTTLRDVTLKKVDKDDPTKMLQGAEFSLYNASDNTVIQTGITTGWDATVVLHGLVTGSNHYYLKETKPPKGYDIPSDADNRFNLTIDETAHPTVTITNEQSKQTFQIKKSGTTIITQREHAQRHLTMRKVIISNLCIALTLLIHGRYTTGQHLSL